MEQVTTSCKGNSNPKSNTTKKKSMNIDMTPMVDLSFLLISFFMLTTTLTKPKMMNLSMPKNETTTDIEASKVLNIICDKNNTIWYYDGNEISTIKKCKSNPMDIRNVILNKQKLVDIQWKKDADGFTKTICLIKMTDDANYQNMIDVLDEMNITSTKVYAFQEILNAELITLNHKK